MKARIKNWWPIGIVISLTAFVAFMLGVVTVCARSSGNLVSRNYYAEGYNLKQITELKTQTALTGWSVKVIASDEQAIFMITDARGTPCDSLQGEAAFYRPSDAGLDIAAASVRAQGGGVYAVKLPRRLESGSWQAKVKLTRGRENYENQIPFFVED